MCWACEAHQTSAGHSRPSLRSRRPLLNAADPLLKFQKHSADPQLSELRATKLLCVGEAYQTRPAEMSVGRATNSASSAAPPRAMAGRSDAGAERRELDRLL